MRPDLHVVVLAAGCARRLQPLTDHLPKCLLEVGGRTLISRAVNALAGHGCMRFTVVDGFMGDLVRQALRGEFPDAWFRFVRNNVYATTNNEVSLWMARYEEPQSMLLLDSDIIFESAVIERMLEDPHENCLALRTRGSIGEEDMKVILGTDGRVTNIAKDVPPEASAGESVGIELFSPRAVWRLFDILHRRVVEEGRTNEFYEASFVELIRSGESLHPVDLGECACLEIDTMDDLRLAREAFAAGLGD